MKQLFIAAFVTLLMNNSRCLAQYDLELRKGLSEIGTAQQAGYALTGFGVLTIIYTAAKSSSVKNPTPYYIAGGVFMAGGLCLLIFGKKDTEPKYWKGMQGYSTKKNLRNDLLIPMFEFSPSSSFHLTGSGRHEHSSCQVIISTTAIRFNYFK